MKYSRDILNWILGIVLVCPLLPTQAGNSVPIFLWGGDASMDVPTSASDPLRTTSQREFEKIVTKILARSRKPVLVFLRDNLCVEDLREHRQSLKHLKDDASWAYLPRVDAPLTVFENLPDYNSTSEEDFESVADGQMIIWNMSDLDSISDTFNMIKAASPNVVAALTGKHCSYVRSERSRRAPDEPSTSTQAPPEPEGFGFNGTRILLWAAVAPNLTIADGTEVITKLTGAPIEEGNGTVESPLRLNFEYTLENGTQSSKANILMEFPSGGGYYYPQVYYKVGEVNHTMKTTLDLAFPYNFSYHCSQKITFGNKSFATFDFIEVQMQIDANDFGDAYDCVGFMSIPIWAGIFVTTILAIIMIWGLTMIMDIRTMDRFDDPKGKTITISVAE